mmetsp:Transcript_11339/g.28546  ORF Transcript_11339/g.28546 Transcript_11339/m.28546 type:complete len:246 (-) Transcript_11339:725-1462(-)
MFEQLYAVVDPVGILPDDPNHGCFGLGLIQAVQILTQVRNDDLVLARVLPEDVPDYHHGLLYHVANLGLDQVKQRVHTPFGGPAQLDGALANRSHRPSDALDVHLGGVLTELRQNLVDVPFRRELHHHRNLFELHVQRIVVFADEHADLLLQDLRLLLHDQIDVSHHDVLDLGFGREQGDQGRCHLFAQCADKLGAGDPVHEFHHDLNGRQNHCAVGMRQSNHHAALENRFCDPRVRRIVHGDGI